MAIDAQLKVLDELGALVGLVHVNDATSASGRAAPVADGEARARLEQIRALLAGTLTVSTGLTTQTDALTNAQLRATPVAVDDDATQTALAGILTELGTKLDAGGTVALDAATLAALESVTATVTGSVSVSNFPASQKVDGTVAVSNHPTPQTNALTNTELRATPVPVSTDAATARESTLEALRLLTVEVRDLATAIRNEQLRRTDTITLADGTTVRTTNDLLAAHAAGLNFVGGTRLNFGGLAATDRYVAAITNPATSGRLAFIYAVVYYTSATQWFRYAQGPTLHSPTAEPKARSLNLAGPAVSAMEMWSDETLPTTADMWDSETRVTVNAPVPLQFPAPIPLAPGQSFAVIGDSSASQSTCANVYFYEKIL